MKINFCRFAKKTCNKKYEAHNGRDPESSSG
jgi:hypothetical protein